MDRIFHDRTEAGRILATRLAHLAHRSEVLVLALPRGGVPVGFEVAQALGLALDVLVVRKLGVPGNQELAMGAIASGGASFRNEPVIATWAVTPREFRRAVARETAELVRREAAYRGSRPAVEVTGRTVIVVDDGIATGSTMRAAIHALRACRPSGLVVAAPVIAADTVQELQPMVDEVVTVLAPDQLRAIGEFYADFRQTTDDEVRALLARATRPPAPRAAARSQPIPEQWVWHYRTLVALRDHLQGARGGRLAEAGEAMEPPSLHGVDFTSELQDRDLAAALPPDPFEARREIEAALWRIRHGVYGICEVSGVRIPADQLRMRPWRRCVEGVAGGVAASGS